jgi:hypothetical protein
MNSIMVDDATAKLVMPMFFSTGKVDLIVSFDAGSSWPLQIGLTINRDKLARVTTSYDVLDYISADQSDVTISWSGLDASTVDVQLFQ